MWIPEPLGPQRHDRLMITGRGKARTWAGSAPLPARNLALSNLVSLCLVLTFCLLFLPGSGLDLWELFLVLLVGTLLETG